MEKPILFSTPMVKAILAGNKTMTRRVIKGQYLDDAPRCGFPAYELEDGRWGFASDDNEWASPYGRPGDHLWVRETWSLWLNDQGLDGYQRCIKFSADNSNIVVPRESCDWWDKREGRGYMSRPSIHMPKWAARLWLKVISVRVERLQDITEEDATAEGVTLAASPLALGEAGTDTYRDAFFRLWNKLNAGRGYGLATNPWVWVVEFERTEKPQAKEPS